MRDFTTALRICYNYCTGQRGEREIVEWKNIATAPISGEAFLITTAGPQVDICYWDEERQNFFDYFHNQVIPHMWPFMVAWRELPEAADVYAFMPESEKV
tara:strand:+ start:356 stop:655 length:300 start_codon:yes stop_codon:yes gene_type:complete